MPAPDRYYSPEEWPRAKFTAPSNPKYYESFLHHEGLKCVTDGLLYFLDPDGLKTTAPLQTAASTTTPTASTAVSRVNARVLKTNAQQAPKLPDLTGDQEIRYVEITQRLVRDDPACTPVVNFSEWYVRDDVFPLQYWQLFCEQQNDEYLFPERIFDHRNFVWIWWNGIPPRGLPVSDELTPAQKEMAIPAGKSAIEQNKPRKIIKEQNLNFNLPEGLDYFHLGGFPPDRLRLFEYPHSFLIIGSKVFYITKLRVASWHNFLHLEEDRTVDYDSDIPEEPVNDVDIMGEGYDKE